MIETSVVRDKEVRFDLISREQEEQYASLLSEGFGIPEGSSFFDDFPVWKSGSGVPVLRVGAYTEGGATRELMSAASARTAYLQLGKDLLKIGLIGGVVTSPLFQGQGLAGECLRKCEDWLKKQGAALAVLWTGDDGWYSKRGYHSIGYQYRIPLQTWSTPGAERMSAFHQGWNTEIGRFFLNRKTGLRIQKWDLGWLTAHQNTDWYWLGSRDRISAYAAVGRGVDLVNTVHEWGGEPSSLRDLLGILNDRQEGLQILGSAESFRGAQILFDPQQSESLAHLKILDLASLNAQMLQVRLEQGLLTETQWLRLFDQPQFPLWFWGLDAA